MKEFLKVKQNLVLKKLISIDSAVLTNGTDIISLLTEFTTIQSSKGEAKRSIKNNAISVNKEKVGSEDYGITSDHLIQGKYIFLENGKKNKFILTFE